MLPLGLQAIAICDPASSLASLSRFPGNTDTVHGPQLFNLHYLAVKKKEILPFATAWMDLENTMLSEISQLEKDKCHVTSLICGI